MEKVAQWGASYFVLVTRYNYADQIRKIGWTGHVACIGQGRNVCRVLVGKPEGKNHLKDQGVDGRMGSKWSLGRLAGGVWSGFN
jgi:hypothetical protein